jgi:serine/threonine-protein kinase
MGTVYEADDLATGRKVALKVSTHADELALRYLQREAEMAIKVRSEHVCHVHHFGVAAGSPFIVMERLHGESLHDRLAATGVLPLAEALSITTKLLDALTATHAMGVIHRDVKPGNIFLTTPPGHGSHLKLIDFGIAMPFHECASPAGASLITTEAEGLGGTFQYMSPEELLGVGPVDQRVDLYAAGLVLFEMLIGRPACKGNSLEDVLQRIVFGGVPRVSEERADVPAAIDDILAMALAKEPRRRFLTAAAFQRALASVSLQVIAG